MCVACRTKRVQHALVRITVDERGHLRPDVARRLGGRGAYVCAQQRCLEQACTRGAWARSLRRGVATCDPRRLKEQVIAAIRSRLEEVVQAALEDGRLALAEGLDRDAWCQRLGQGGGELAEQLQVVDARLGREMEALAEQLNGLRRTET